MRLNVGASKRCMAKLPRGEAEALAAQIYDAMREPLIKVVADLLAEPDPYELSLRQVARVERAAASWRRKLERLPAERRRKVG